MPTLHISHALKECVYFILSIRRVILFQNWAYQLDHFSDYVIGLYIIGDLVTPTDNSGLGLCHIAYIYMVQIKSYDS